MHFSPLNLSDLMKPLVYLDPGSGSLIIQMLIAAFVGGGLLLRAFWSRLTGKSKKDEDDSDDLDETEEEDDHRS